jgi:hypothetical protein
MKKQKLTRENSNNYLFCFRFRPSEADVVIPEKLYNDEDQSK